MSRRDPLAELSIVIPSWNTRELLLQCVASLAPARSRGSEVIVVDDASSDGSAEALERECADVAVLRNAQSSGFAASVNRGARLATRRWLLLLNADTALVGEPLVPLLAFLEQHPAYAAAAPRLLDPDGGTQRACMGFPGWWTPLFFGTPLERFWPASPELRRYFLRDFDHEHDADVVQPPAAALLLAREEFLELGGMDEGLPLFFNDVDLCLRLHRRGRRVRYLAGATLVHRRGASTRQLDDFAARWHRDRLAYYRKHHGRLAGAWVKLCTSASLLDHVLRSLVAPREQARREPLLPLARAFGAYLRS